MGTLYGSQLNLDDPTLGQTTDDPTILRQRGEIALSTAPGSVQSDPLYGFVWDWQIMQALSPTGLAMLPQQVQQALEAEPSIASSTVSITSQSATAGGTSLALAITLTGATEDSVGLSLAGG